MSGCRSETPAVPIRLPREEDRDDRDPLRHEMQRMQIPGRHEMPRLPENEEALLGQALPHQGLLRGQRFGKLRLLPQLSLQGAARVRLRPADRQRRRPHRPVPGLGGGKMPDIDEGEAEKNMARTTAIIYSMTKKERSNPSLLNPSRKHRIAKGAGVDISEVNRLVKQFEQAKKMMKQMPGLMGGRGRGGKMGKFKFPF